MNGRHGVRVAVGALLVIAACGVELAARSMARASWLAALFGVDLTAGAVLAGAVVATAIALGALLAAQRLSIDHAAAIVLACAFSAGMVAQLRLGARLQSDGFYYFAYLRSLWFDGDVNLTNDYRLLGLDDKPHLFVPTPTGYAQTAWSIGPSLMWAPFFAVGDRIAKIKAARGQAVAVDGTSYPYRQAACVAGLFWGLVGIYLSFRLARRFATPAGAAVGTTAIALGSFVLWYLVKEPSMAHAPSLCVVAAFTTLWAGTRGHRSGWQWAALGLLAGLMAAVRWQNVLFAALPALEWAIAAVRLGRAQQAALPAHVRHAAFFGAMTIVGLAPQLLAWKAIYGSWFAVSPISPQIRWWDSHWADVLWSSRNGLLAMSPVLYLGLAGLIVLWRRDRMTAAASVAVLGAMVVLNGAVQDWWGGAAFGGRRFDSTIPVFVIGAALAFDAAASWVGRHPRVVAGTAVSGFVVWNLTLMDTAIDGTLQLEAPNAFGQVAARQAEALHRWIGHPFSYPATLVFAWRNGVSPADADSLWPNRFLGDPARPYGRIDIGGDDQVAIAAGWYPAEREGSTSFRWASRQATVRMALDHAATLRVQVRAKAMAWREGPPQTLAIAVNGHPQPPLALAADWQIVEQVVPVERWRGGVNHLRLDFAHAVRPSDIQASSDRRELAAAVDFVRVAVVF